MGRRRGAAAVATRESARVGDLCGCVVGRQMISSAGSVKLKCYAQTFQTFPEC